MWKVAKRVNLKSFHHKRTILWLYVLMDIAEINCDFFTLYANIESLNWYLIPQLKQTNKQNTILGPGFSEKTRSDQPGPMFPWLGAEQRPYWRVVKSWTVGLLPVSIPSSGSLGGLFPSLCLVSLTLTWEWQLYNTSSFKLLRKLNKLLSANHTEEYLALSNYCKF